jgi:predicted DNA-binding transcriptional regulator AlpA
METELSSGPMFLRSRAVAELLDVAISTLNVWRQTGKGPKYIRLCGRKRPGVRYRLSELERWIARRSVESEDSKGE